jgi:hypothetical protein
MIDPGESRWEGVAAIVAVIIVRASLGTADNERYAKATIIVV